MKKVKFLFLMITTMMCKELLDFSEKDWPEQCAEGLRNSPINFPENSASNYIVSQEYISIISSSYSIIQGKSFSQDSNKSYKYFLNMENSGNLMIKKGDVLYSYNILDVHIHIPSSHTFQGSSYDLELHIHHEKDTQYLIDQGVLDDPDKANKYLTVAILFNVEGTELNLEIQKMNIATLAPINQIDLNLYVNSTKNFYHYEGSRTVPDCEEDVNWLVLEDIETLSATQYADFQNWIYQDYPLGNTRMTKPLYGRSIYHAINSCVFLTLPTILIFLLNLFLLL